MNMLAGQPHVESKNMLWLELTNFCNLQCGHCYNTSGPHESLESSLSPSRYQQILDEARAIEFRRVQFIGGEPMFYPHLKRLVDHAMSAGFEEIEIFSNLTTVPTWLLSPRYRGLKVATSFYSDISAIHDAIANVRGAFDRTVSSIKKLVAAGFSIRAGVIEMDINAGHFDRARELLNRLGVTSVSRDGVREFGRADHQGQPDMSELCGHCSQGNLSIDVNGKASACIMSKPWAFGSVHGTHLQELFDSTDRRNFVRDLERNVEKRKRISPEMYDLYSQGDCAPRCIPQNNCNPCQPLGQYPCGPNDRCTPTNRIAAQPRTV